MLVCLSDTNFVGFHFVGNRVVDGESLAVNIEKETKKLN